MSDTPQEAQEVTTSPPPDPPRPPDTAEVRQEGENWPVPPLESNLLSMFSGFTGPKPGEDADYSWHDLSMGIDGAVSAEEDVRSFLHGAVYETGSVGEVDRVEVNFHDSRKDFTDRSMAYSTSISTARDFRDIEEVKEGLALKDEWGERDEVTIWRIPAGTEVERWEGDTKPQYDKDLGRDRPGMAPQNRWREWDSSWDHITMSTDEFFRRFGKYS